MYEIVNPVAEVTVNVNVVASDDHATAATSALLDCARQKSGVEPKPCVTTAVVVAVVAD